MTLNRFNLAASGAVLPKKHEIERVAVAFGVQRTSIAVLAGYGSGVEAEMSDGDIHEAFLEPVTEKDPEIGIWIWEGVPVSIWSSNGDGFGSSEFDGFDFSRGTWRPATPEELLDLVRGVSPWGSVLEDEAAMNEESYWGTA